MDEAGSPLAAAELSFQLLGWPRSFFLPAPSPYPLRNLTLGVLIVTGGTLAALPFRRSPAVTEASSQNISPQLGQPHLSQSPTQATGTLESALDPAPVHAVASTGIPARSGSNQPFSRQEIPGLDEFIRDDPPAPSSDYAVADRSHSSVKPLTYEDLMAPITRPEPIQDRYQAIAAVRADSLQKDKELAMELPPVTQLAPQLRHEFQQRFTSMRPSSSHPSSVQPSSVQHRQSRQPIASQSPDPARAGGTLASSMISRTPSLPELSQAPMAAEADQRSRHWIVQP